MSVLLCVFVFCVLCLFMLLCVIVLLHIFLCLCYCVVLCVIMKFCVCVIVSDFVFVLVCEGSRWQWLDVRAQLAKKVAQCWLCYSSLLLYYCTFHKKSQEVAFLNIES